MTTTTETLCAWCDREAGELPPNANHSICNFHKFMVVSAMQEETARAQLQHAAESLLPAALSLVAEGSAP